MSNPSNRRPINLPTKLGAVGIGAVIGACLGLYGCPAPLVPDEPLPACPTEANPTCPPVGPEG